MKKHSSFAVSARTILSLLLLLSGAALFAAIPLTSSRAATKAKVQAPAKHSKTTPAAIPSTGPNPASGTIHPGDASPVNWSGTTMSPGGNVNSEANCVENVTCETFTLTVSGSPSDWAGKKVQVLLSWQSIANEYDVYIHQGSNSGALVTSAAQGPGLTSQVAFIDPAANGTGVFTVHVVYDTTPNITDVYTGSVSVVNASSVGQTSGLPVAAPADNGPAIGYENFEAPGLLTNGTGTSSGGLTVEYMGRGAGEPSIGANWNTGIINFQSDLETLFVTFDDSCSLTNSESDLGESPGAHLDRGRLRSHWIHRSADRARVCLRADACLVRMRRKFPSLTVTACPQPPLPRAGLPINRRRGWPVRLTTRRWAAVPTT